MKGRWLLFNPVKGKIILVKVSLEMFVELIKPTNLGAQSPLCLGTHFFPNAQL